MILVACLVLGLALRLTTGRSLTDLGRVGLRGEAMLLGLLVLQSLPSLVTLPSSFAKAAYLVWLGTFPCIVVIAWLNRREPGIAMLGIGLALNLAVIVSNGGMPVDVSAVHAVKSIAGPVPIATTDFIHVRMTSATLLPWLADIIPLAGPTWFRSVASPGDCLLLSGIVAFLATASPSRFAD